MKRERTRDAASPDVAMRFEEAIKTAMRLNSDVLVLREDGSFSPLELGERIYSGAAEHALDFYQRLKNDPELESLRDLLSQRSISTSLHTHHETTAPGPL